MNPEHHLEINRTACLVGEAAGRRPCLPDRISPPSPTKNCWMLIAGRLQSNSVPREVLRLPSERVQSLDVSSWPTISYRRQ
jgi:hypothetical protein